MPKQREQRPLSIEIPQGLATRLPGENHLSTPRCEARHEVRRAECCMRPRPANGS